MSTKRQAIVLIHGIGEQYPTTTLRSFVESVAEQLKKDKLARHKETLFWEKPDPASGNYETRKMTMRRGSKHPSTDFFEFYWAHHMRETNFSHIKDWLFRVVFRKPQDVSKRLLPVYWVIWILIALVVLGVVIYFKADVCFLKTLSPWVSTVGAIVLGIVATYFFNYLGDAGRYLDPAPGNIAERQAIRSEGINFLKRIHESGKYDRVVLVGHSLGSVIAYDLVKILWNEYNKTFDIDKVQSIVGNNESAKLKSIYASEHYATNLNAGNGDVKGFKAAQSQSFDYLQMIGNKWLITDLVTIGSPLAHAGHLFVQQKGLFDKLKNQREYPLCPPHFQHPDKTNILTTKPFNISSIAHPFQINYFNHSSPFAVTKWTNMYYTSDFIGGPLQGLFGVGIEDIAVEKKNRCIIIPKGHTTYWDFEKPDNILQHIWQILNRQSV